ncbi:MAG: PEP motif anchor domain-containing protein [Gallionellaceae bacterium]|nr:MAG: PEP motif anchor domain-containing protein [Gallionellaceae bacterium]
MKNLGSLFAGIGLAASLLAGATSAQAQTVVLQPGPATGKDIWTTSVYSYVPPGGGPGGGLNNEHLRVGGWGDLYYSLIEFDLTGLAPVATSARLELFAVPEVHGFGTTDLYLDRITEFWDWRVQGTGADMERLWWADRPAAIQWSAGSLSAPQAGQWYSIDITDLYNGWQSGAYANYGVQLRPTQTWNTWSVFYSSDYMGDPSLRPRLVLDGPPSGVSPSVGAGMSPPVSAVPEPETYAMLLVGLGLMGFAARRRKRGA